VLVLAFDHGLDLGADLGLIFGLAYWVGHPVGRQMVGLVSPIYEGPSSAIATTVKLLNLN
jgi:hypothetical protein